MLLKPGPMVRALFLYLLAWAAQPFDIMFLAAYVGGDHYHLIVYDPHGRVSCFVERLNGMAARILNWRWARWLAPFWDNRKVNLVRLVDADVALAKAAYVAANPTQDGLLWDPSKWPGVWLTAKDLGKDLVCKRPNIKFFGKKTKMPATVSLKLGLPPQLKHLTLEQYRERHDSALEARLTEARNGMKAAGRSFLGLKVLAATRPEQQATRPEARGGIRPQVAASCRKLRKAALEEIACFRAAYGKALERFTAGERDVVFPLGTYQMRVRLGVQVAES